MAEKVEYYRDLKSGFYKERVRNKKNEFMLKGTATIQIFENDELVKEVVSRNCICERWVSALYYDFVNEVFLKGKREYISSGMLSYMNLSDYAGEEDPRSLLAMGNVIGYANLGYAYSGADTKQGSINEAESSIGKWNRHIVIDFPTHAANGTFSSIYMTRSSKIGIYDLVSKESSILNDLKLSNYSVLIGITGVRYIVVNERALEIYQQGSSVSIARTELSEKIDDLQWTGKLYNNMVYMRFRSENKISIYNAMDISYVTTLTIDLNAIYTMELYKDHIYIVGTEEADKFGLFKYKINGQRVKKICDIYKSTEYGGNNIAYGSWIYNDHLYINLPNYYDKANRMIYVFDLSNESWTTYEGNAIFACDNHYGAATTYASCNVIQTGDKMLSSYFLRNGGNHHCNIYELTVYPYISHTKLPAPVTKTSANTMKIQYDYEIEPKEPFE